MSKEKTPHVHAQWIKAKADGEVIQRHPPSFSSWVDMKSDDWHFEHDCEFRIKPSAPETRMTESDIAQIIRSPGLSDGGFHIPLTVAVAIANAAIARALADGDVVLP